MKYLDISPDHSPNGMRFSNSPSSASVASRLYSNGQRSSRQPSTAGSEPELINLSDSEVYSEFNDISTQVSSLSRRMNMMEESQTLSSEERSRLRTENAVLKERVHTLEEQQQNTEQLWREKLEEEKSKHRDVIGRMEREKELEINGWQWKHEMIETTSEMNKKERDRYYDELTQMQSKYAEVKEELEDAQSLCTSLETDKKNLQREFVRFREDAHLDLENSSELVEELTRQTNELRQRSLPVPRQGSLADQIVMLEDEIERMRLEIKTLREQNDELQAQLLHDSVERGRCLLADGPLSLAEELNGKDSTELMNALKEQEICNQKLRVYIDGILMRVIERHPEILQISGNASAEPSSS